MSAVTVQADQNLTPEEVVKIRTASGWEGDVEEWRYCLTQNLLNVSARDPAGEVVGVGFLTGNTRHAEITDLAVLPAYREQAVGGSIVACLCDYAKEHGIRYLGLTYDKSSPWLKAFYEKHGFRPIDFAMWHENSLKSQR